MEYATVRGVPVPALGFGTWQLRGPDCFDGVLHALALGYRHLDTARMYGNETEVGRAIKASGVDRDEIFLTTKLWRSDVGGKRVRPATEQSLQRLETDVVDLLLVHWPVDDVPISETMTAMREVQEAGLVRHLGVSNFNPRRVREAAQHAAIFCNQVEYHPFLDQGRLLALADELDHLLTAYSPLAMGRVIDDPTIQALAERCGRTSAQVTLRWLVQQPRVAAIPRSSRSSHREANIAIFDFVLSDDEMKAISELARARP